MKRNAIILWCALAALTAVAREPQTDMGIRQQDDATMKWWLDAKFGMFIHWGLYAVPAKGEWYMENAGDVRIDTIASMRLTRATASILTPRIIIPPNGRDSPKTQA